MFNVDNFKNKKGYFEINRKIIKKNIKKDKILKSLWWWWWKVIDKVWLEKVI